MDFVRLKRISKTIPLQLNLSIFVKHNHFIGCPGLFHSKFYPLYLIFQVHCEDVNFVIMWCHGESPWVKL